MERGNIVRVHNKRFPPYKAVFVSEIDHNLCMVRVKNKRRIIKKNLIVSCEEEEKN